ncbi:hypothetical protein GCM10011360_01410 [Primorskyibacter flagellatus]|uniref:VPLPA-CTERM protein sorting domain-containing protein n=1 Tax=Primorskyibacter flagellatus TaxID=1387277 RepID=A0A916ZVV4_9RHOB|nr:hypothetical protein [Primorskyibacter flagellatus]GGE16390.1 hypothetical protein GCM10011360_01410 [Primorskyibacter flagellatus]
MAFRFLSFSTLSVIAAAPALSAPVSATSTVDYYHSFILNSGAGPAGLEFSLLGLDVDTGAEAEVQTTPIVPDDVRSTQVSHPYTDPPLPYFDRRVVAERTQDLSQVARAAHNVTITNENGTENALSNMITRREVDNDGSAVFMSADGLVSGSARSNYLIDRFFRYTNESASTVSFNILGEFSASVGAGFSGGDGLARASLSYEFEVDPTAGVSVTYLPLAPYLRTIDDDDAGVFVSETLVTGPDGFTFSAGASSSGPEGGDGLFEGGFRYALLFTMEAGSSFVLNDRFVQNNSVMYTAPATPQVPLPATLPVLLLACGGLGVLRRRRRIEAR